MGCESKYITGNFKCDDDCKLKQYEKRLLNDKDIKFCIDNDFIVIEPILDLNDQIGTSGFDLRLDVIFKEFKYMKQACRNPKEKYSDEELYEVKIFNVDEPYYLQPNKFVLAQSFERIWIPGCIACRLGGKSTLGRMGVGIHVTAESVDPGFHGHLTFELTNYGDAPVKLESLIPIGRLTFFLTEPVGIPYGGSYTSQDKPTSPHLK